MKIAVLVSGGVDSSIALQLLKEQGHSLAAFYLKIWLEDELAFLGECPWEEDIKYARAVCEQAGVPLQVLSLQKEYRERIVAYTLEEVGAGRTPNPDMLCNARIKFGAFSDAVGRDFDAVATGHYAQTEGEEDAIRLKMSPDRIKDQTYFLAQLSQTHLSRARFPVGRYDKRAVRALAERFALPNAKRKDSQGICFLGKIPFDEFLRHHLGQRFGPLIEYETHKVLGTHAGFWYFTVGQRRGIRLSGGPWYVVAKNPQANEVFVSHAIHQKAHARDTFMVGALNWISGEAPAKNILHVKVRHGAKQYPARLEPQGDGGLKVTFQEEKDSGIAEGQFAVFYDGDVCLGGGTILGKTIS